MGGIGLDLASEPHHGDVDRAVESLGDAAAQAIQLAIEYDPAPPFAGGHPDRAPAAVTEGLKARVYDAAAARMAAALKS